MEKKTQGSFRNRERKNRSEMHKSLIAVKCTLLNGSAWSTEKK